ncbi:hypothetical protein LOTGIDRAFT_167812 [Lottia gigantea]|uniref:GH18 domain-containing protein n=1 Tax=Lottia gigantea TaxID=225164 RepID=V3ZNF8_LOTGI|nr:hypothetical protein LOTGIDRAFT_167812 [Lottia gigantea]ESO85832.1 hypothetical protein LOTGIDRAFT_167812 [Lottia gigantea]
MEKGIVSILIAFAVYYQGTEAQVQAPRIVCYYTNWAQYRTGGGQFLPTDINAEMCSHVVYAHAGINLNYSIRSTEWNDLPSDNSPGMYPQIISLKNQNPELKVLLSVGGFALSPSFTFLVQSKLTRDIFIVSALRYLREWGFDGIDIMWEYPTRRGSKLDDRQKFTSFIEELRDAINSEAIVTKLQPLILSASVSAAKMVIDDAYDIVDIVEAVDFVNIMSYDFTGHWDGWTGHHAPLYQNPEEVGPFTFNNVNRSVLYWVEQGAPPYKVNVGMSPYARTYTIESNNETVPGVRSVGPGRAGAITQEPGGLAYYEVCNIASDGEIFWDEIQRVPYMVLDDQWISFDNERSTLEKLEFIKRYDFGGVMLWNLPSDDFINSCGSGNFPMLTTIFEELVLKSVIP